MNQQLVHLNPNISYLSVMDLKSEKIELAKRLLETEDERIVLAVKAIFTNAGEGSGEWGDLPESVINDAKESIRQLKAGKGIPHEHARETYKKWL